MKTNKNEETVDKLILTKDTRPIDENKLGFDSFDNNEFNKLPFKNIRQRAIRPLQIIHSDMMGKISPQTHPKRYKFISVFN